jgi:hypothetical protein
MSFVILAFWRRSPEEELALLPEYKGAFPPIKERLIDWGLWRFLCPVCGNQIHQKYWDKRAKTARCHQCEDRAHHLIFTSSDSQPEIQRLLDATGLREEREIIPRVLRDHPDWQASVDKLCVHPFDRCKSDVSDAEAVNTWRLKTQQVAEMHGQFVAGQETGIGLGRVEPKNVRSRDSASRQERDQSGRPMYDPSVPYPFWMWKTLSRMARYDEVNQYFFLEAKKWDDGVRKKEKLEAIRENPVRAFRKYRTLLWAWLWLRGQLPDKDQMVKDVAHLNIMMLDQMEQKTSGFWDETQGLDFE